MKNVDLMYDSIFKEKKGRNKFLFEQFDKIYNLPILTTDSEVSNELFAYCLKKEYFVSLLLYDEKGRVFFERNMSDSLTWGLPGGSIRDNESFNQAIMRLAQNINKNMLIGNVEPIAYIENNFKYNSKVKKHLGVGFIARVRNLSELNLERVPGGFIEVNEEELKYINRLASKKWFNYLFLDFLK